MNDFFGQMAQRTNLLHAGAVATAGGLAGGGTYLSISGVILGVVLALGILGILAVVTSTLARGAGESFEPALAGAGGPVSASGYTSSSAPQTGPASEIAMASSPSGPGDGSKIVESTLPPGIPIEPVKIEATETEAGLLAAGRFADYHLAKAKRFFDAKNFKEAAYQAAASLAHGDLAEAKQLRAQARAASKG